MKKNRKGRAMGRLLMGIRKEIREREEVMKIEEEGLIEENVKV